MAGMSTLWPMSLECNCDGAVPMTDWRVVVCRVEKDH